MFHGQGEYVLLNPRLDASRRISLLSAIVDENSWLLRRRLKPHLLPSQALRPIGLCYSLTALSRRAGQTALGEISQALSSGSTTSVCSLLFLPSGAHGGNQERGENRCFKILLRELTFDVCLSTNGH